MSNLIYLKIDTTGTDMAKDRLLLISALKVTGTGREQFHRFILPDGKWSISDDARKVNGITEDFIKENGESAVKVLSDFNNFVNKEDGNDIVTFNGLNFDVRMLSVEAAHYGVTLDLEFHRMFDLYEIETRNNPNDFTSTYIRHVGLDKDTVNGNAPKKTPESIERLFWKMSKDYTREQMLGNFKPTILDLDNLYRMDKEGNLVFVRGKHFGEKVYDTILNDPDYIVFLFKNIMTERSKRIVINDYEKRKKMVETEPIKK